MSRRNAGRNGRVTDDVLRQTITSLRADMSQLRHQHGKLLQAYRAQGASINFITQVLAAVLTKAGLDADEPYLITALDIDNARERCAFHVAMERTPTADGSAELRVSCLELTAAAREQLREHLREHLRDDDDDDDEDSGESSRLIVP